MGWNYQLGVGLLQVLLQACHRLADLRVPSAPEQADSFARARNCRVVPNICQDELGSIESIIFFWRVRNFASLTSWPLLNQATHYPNHWSAHWLPCLVEAPLCICALPPPAEDSLVTWIGKVMLLAAACCFVPSLRMCRSSLERLRGQCLW